MIEVEMKFKVEYPHLNNDADGRRDVTDQFESLHAYFGQRGVVVRTSTITWPVEEDADAEPV